MINLNNGHTPLSPGGVSGGRTEYGECARLIEAVRKGLEGAEVIVTEGTGGYTRDGLLFIFHKGTSMKNAPKRGAEIFVPENASASGQYNAYRLLSSMCGEKAFRYGGVHTLTPKSPFVRMGTLGNENAYLIKAGYIDFPRDNEIWDRECEHIATALSQEIMKIYKEKTNENYS